MTNTAERIKEALNIRNMKQAELVEKTKIGKSSISTYISGAYEPKQKNLYKIAKALNVSEAWLMGYDVSMDSKLTPDEAWNKESECFQVEMNMRMDKENAFKFQLKILGWEYERVESSSSPDYDLYYIFKKENASFRVSSNDYDSFIEDSETFYTKRLQLLFEQSVIELFPQKKEDKSYLDPVAAHERTDIEVTDEMRKHDDDLMNDDDLWK